MKKTWILVANAAQAKIYQLQSNTLVLVEEFSHPQSRLKKNDILATEGGNHDTKSYGKGYARNNTSFHSDVKQVEQLNFAKELSAFLEQATAQFTELMVVAAPDFHGLLNQELPKTVQKMVSRHIQKNYVQLAEDELLTILQTKPDYA